MAKNTYKSNTFKKPEKPKSKSRLRLGFFRDQKFIIVSGIFLIILSIFLAISFISYLFTYSADQSILEATTYSDIRQSGLEIKNWLGLLGAYSSYYLIFRWFGMAAFFIPPLLFVIGVKIALKYIVTPIPSLVKFSMFFMFWISLLMGYITLNTNEVDVWSFLSGGIGYELAILFHGLMGWGTYLFLVFSLVVFLVYYFDINNIIVPSFAGERPTVKEKAYEDSEEESPTIEDETETEEDLMGWTIKDPVTKPKTNVDGLELAIEDKRDVIQKPDFPISAISKPETDFGSNKLDLEVHEAEEDTFSDKIENYDPTLDLSSYKYPHLELLAEHATGNIEVTKEELEQNKDKIVETLINFKIGISTIKATIGPTVTLYEIVPEAGVKISKIKNLEDDIALNLAALGIRIIAPIPGKGTIGIEVPNKNREMVTIRSVLNSDKFMKSDKELPVVLGKTISNEVFVADLAKMPHLLMAGATGQGKSVGINVLLASLLYKKHPSQIKFVLVDPKKVELTLYNTLERHFLAKLPNNEEAIITDTKQVVYTLNSLCIEMDTRYNLLKEAGCRNLKEYNHKFVHRRLNPEKGHRFLPYIVVVIDELSDLMITAGKEVETPIIRLAQLARAIGIHLVVATQRPSVNVITGIIKANFPARISFRVTSKVDSRTILDQGGAEQLIGMGDMLLSHGSEIIRLQCPFVDTSEVETVCEWIGSQRGYESAYLLPEYIGDEEGEGYKDVDLSDRDELFDEAARLIVAHQQGSTSLIQRKMKLGYNRAGRLIDQLEAAGIVGPFEGSKAREVLIRDEYSLEQLLNSLNNNT
jgi:DNA segregation ATPase FtsK/SpoIIIE, S-DNA-T family